MKRLTPTTSLMVSKMAVTILCCTIVVSLASAQTPQTIKADPGTNNPSPPGAIFDLAGTPIPGGGSGNYQQYSVNFTAYVTNTAITFAFRNDPSFIELAAVSVVDVTIASSNLLTNGDFSGTTYSNNGNDFTPTGWIYVNSYGAASGGIVESGGLCSPYNFCFYDGAVQAYDAISQTIPTTLGHNYQISFWVASGCPTDMAFGLPCNFSNLSTDGDSADTGGNGTNLAVYAQAGLPSAGQIQSGSLTTGTESLFNFLGGFGSGGYDYNAELTSGSTVTAQVTAITPPAQAVCNQIVQANPSFGTAECFSYQNSGGTGVNLPVMFEVTCPASATGACNPDIAGTDFSMLLASNPNLAFSHPTGPLTSSAGGPPLVGFLEGAGLDPVHPCATNPDGITPLFTSNQISSFSSGGAISNHVAGVSAGSSACWVATYLTPNEAPSVSIAAPANGAIYQQNQSTAANYACSTADNAGSTGPYLTKSACNATDSPGGTVNQGAQFDTANLGTHTFTATVVDSATNTVSQTVSYNVVGPTDMAILNLAPPGAQSGSKLTYNIVVADLGPSTAANVSMNDVLPTGASFVSASGTNIACSVVNKRQSCTTTAIPCTFAGSTVSCNVGTVMPLSFFSVNGAIIEVTTKVTALPGTTKNPTVLRDTAVVAASNAETRPGSNSSTATTIVTGGH